LCDGSLEHSIFFYLVAEMYLAIIKSRSQLEIGWETLAQNLRFLFQCGVISCLLCLPTCLPISDFTSCRLTRSAMQHKLIVHFICSSKLKKV